MKKISFVSVLFLSLLFVGCGKTVQNQPQINLDTIQPKAEVQTENVNPPNPDEDLPENIKPEKDAGTLAGDIKSFGLKTDSYLFCLNEAVSGCQQVAVQDEIQKTKSAKPCDYLGTELEKGSCRDNAWMNLAMVDGEMKFCENISGVDLKDNCFASVAESVAITTGSAEGCQKINDEVAQKECENSVYQSLALANLEASLCEKIVSEFEEEVGMCKEMVQMEKEMEEEEARMLEEQKEMEAEMEKQAELERAEIEVAPTPVEAPAAPEEQ